MAEVARYAVETVPGTDGAGLTLCEGDRVDTRVATAGFVSAVDEAQHGLGDGPCDVLGAVDVCSRSPDVFGERAAQRDAHRPVSERVARPLRC